MTAGDKSKLWTMCLDSVGRKQPQPKNEVEIEAGLKEAKEEAGKLFRTMVAEIGDAEPDWNGISGRMP